MSGAPGPQEWYYTAGDTHVGPVLFERLLELAREGKLNPRSDMVWGPGLAEWTRAGEVDGLFERREKSPVAAPAATTGGGAGLVQADPDSVPEEVEPWDFGNQEWPGVDRRSYFFAVVLVPILVQVVLTVGLNVAGDMLGQGGQSAVSLVLAGLAAVVGLWASIQRFPNLGMSRWWFLGHFVPLLNLWVGFRCFACPPGYACFRKLDGIGWVLAVLYWLLVLLGIVALAFTFVMLGSLLDDPEKLKKLLEQFGAKPE